MAAGYIPGVGTTLRITAGSFSNGQAGINVTHWVVAALGTGGVSQSDIAIAFDALLAPLYKAAMHAVASWYGVKVQRVRPLPVLAADVASNHVGIGTFGPDPMPSQASGIITLQTGTAGRSGRGRQYIPFPASLAVDVPAEKPSNNYVLALNGIKTALTNDQVVTSGVSTTTLTPVIFHRATGATTVVAGGRSNFKWATQKRRGDYTHPDVYPPF